MRAQKIDKTYSAKQQNTNGWITEAGSGIGPNQVEVHCQGRVKKKKHTPHHICASYCSELDAQFPEDACHKTRSDIHQNRLKVYMQQMKTNCPPRTPDPPKKEKKNPTMTMSTESKS